MEAPSVRPTTTLGRAILALVLGALVAGFSWGIVYFAGAMLGRIGHAEDRTPLVILPIAIQVSLVYAAGLIVVSPCWWLLHRLGWRQWWVGPILGAALSLIAVVAFEVAIQQLPYLIRYAQTDPQFLALLVALAGIGALVGFVVWRVAYRQVVPASTARADVFA